ncbi:Type II restriction/modification system, methyltransferase [Bifidobacterium pseudolongum subsp. globosum]|uniref:DNA adenine methylase n=1 Tax=Bifidobacterium pseudolongum TaxID=1694 RepID=UPI0010207E77|nr:DNA adenine methylase [Bifidobacterium pseudolongum]RYQ02694.1 Type II restriction/modification system, methyltransferase [Bifidobacterium pseudolongum subsp. globosum]
MAKNPVLKPILKWVGGKRQLLDDILPLIPPCSTYVEPFVGGGAVLLALQPKKAIINDYNSELINVYWCVRDQLEELLELLKRHQELNSADHFYEVRALDRESHFNDLPAVERAARVIYLNKTCFNGLYRVNAAGQFNSPYGRYKNPAIVNEPVLRAMSAYLNSGVKILCGDYAQALKGLRRGAFVYLDPPYMPISSSSSFTGYTEGGFDYGEQVRLKEECDKLVNRGVHFIQSNSDCAEIRNLYSGYDIITVHAKRAINSRGNRRGEINEVLIRG